VFREAGFEVIETWTDYDGQYLMIAAKPCSEIGPITNLERDAPSRVAAAINTFVPRQAQRVRYWKQQLSDLTRQGNRAVVWGSGSKGVAFLTMLNLDRSVEYVVDINPYRQGKFMAGTGQQIVAPEFLRQYKPDVAIAMNPVYKAEIQKDLRELGLHTTVLSV
jgi:hypothetical protein